MTRYTDSRATVPATLGTIGTVFAPFDARTQDSGHVSYGVLSQDGRRWFVKTAGGTTDSPGGATHAERVEALLRATAIQREVRHEALVPLEAVITATDGVLVVHDWFPGELLRSPAGRRDDPAEAGCQFRRLDRAQIVSALDLVVDLHVELEREGWIAGDFYDGSLMYDFATRRIRVIDLESYHRGPFVNEVGRFGSTRFMAPEEYAEGATIDARTTVFNLGRMMQILLADQIGASDLVAVGGTG